jgi:hypothetical protein
VCDLGFRILGLVLGQFNLTAASIAEPSCAVQRLSAAHRDLLAVAVYTALPYSLSANKPLCLQACTVVAHLQ